MSEILANSYRNKADECIKLTEDITRLREALEFYADEVMYVAPVPDRLGDIIIEGPAIVMVDGGHIAREALKGGTTDDK